MSENGERKGAASAAPTKGEEDRPEAAAGGAGNSNETAGGDAAEAEETPEEVIEGLRERLKAERARLLRAVADLENFKKRASREREQYMARAGEALARDLLPVLDNLDRAMEHASESNDAKSLADGVKLIHKQFLDGLLKHGIEGFDAVGERFDPMRHEAMSQQTSPDAEPMTVLSQFARGYTIRGHLLRPAMVIVAGADSGGSKASDAPAVGEGEPEVAWDDGGADAGGGPDGGGDSAGGDGSATS